MTKVMLGMSGGVDSSAAAKLLLESGYDVTGVTLRLFDAETCSCGSLSEAEYAKSAADKLGIEHLLIDFRKEFSERVTEPFSGSYLRGETPNPCIECNRYIKFGKMLEEAEKRGFDYIATGHYAVCEYDERTGRYVLKRPADRSKDQTYVLYSLTQRQLSKTLFPLGNYKKTEIRKIAEESGLINADKPDSQDICFVPDGDYAAFIKKSAGIVPAAGDFIDLAGKPIGRHKGVINYTIGQRRGLGISLGAPAYVVEKDAELNTVTLGSEKDLYKSEIAVYDVNLIAAESIQDGMRVTVKTRYSQNESGASLYPDGDLIKVKFDSPQRAPAPGQAAVFYDGDAVIGGGTIK